MCGLFGAIGKGINPLIIRGLAIANRSRGKESLGMFDSTGKKIKSASDPTDCLTRSNFSAFIERKHWFIAGHTRKATRGVINKKNAHPFRYGNIIGSHNGQVTAPPQYDVDSQYLFDMLSRNLGNYAEAFKGIQGYWALTWFDGKHFYLQAYDNKLTLARKGNTWYYSSDRDHLSAAIGKADEWITLENGATIRFASCGKLERLEAFVSTAGRGGFYKSSTSGYKSAAGTSIVGGTYQKPYTPSQLYREHYGNVFSPDLPGGGYGRAVVPQSNYNQMLTSAEFDDAQELALECGYNGFYDYIKMEEYVAEYTAYSALKRAHREQEEQEYEDAEYEQWDAERCQAEVDAEADGEDCDFPEFDDWLAEKEDAEWAKHDADAEDDERPGSMDFQEWSESRDRKQLRIGFNGDDMDGEFKRLCDRDDAIKFLP